MAILISAHKPITFLSKLLIVYKFVLSMNIAERVSILYSIAAHPIISKAWYFTHRLAKGGSGPMALFFIDVPVTGK